ncbi:amidase [Streptomonospora sediminis]
MHDWDSRDDKDNKGGTVAGVAGAARTAELVLRGDIGAAAAVEGALEAIDQLDAGVNAFAEVWPEWAREQAARVGAALARGDDLPLAGVPIGVKRSEGIGSVQAQRLMAAGAVPVGATAVPGTGTPWKTWGTTGRGATANPWRPGASPGGSSAGSGAAVAAGMVPLATASDGAGSTRIPAAWCGAVGYKPTTGLLPARDDAGLTVGGPIARRVADIALYRSAVLASGAPPTPGPGGGPDGAALRVAWSADLGFNRVHPQVEEAAYVALREWAGKAALDVRGAGLDLADPAAQWHAARTGEPGEHPPGTAADGRRNAARLAELFTSCDLLATPATPNPPHGPNGPGETMSVGLTWLFNITGHPAISLPAGFLPDGSPVGLQLVAAHHADESLIRAAADYERARPWPLVAPPGGR